jgi:hypothetical protein
MLQRRAPNLLDELLQLPVLVLVQLRDRGGERGLALGDRAVVVSEAHHPLALLVRQREPHRRAVLSALALGGGESCLLLHIAQDCAPVQLLEAQVYQILESET